MLLDVEKGTSCRWEAGNGLVFYKEEEALTGVVKIADKVRKDVSLVFDDMPEVTTDVAALGNYSVIYGTVGRSLVLEKLSKSGQIDLSPIEGKREVFLFQLVEAPFPEVSSALVIAGSDKRGTIYGLFHLSECLGVSPLVDWSDVRPVKQERVVLTEKNNWVSKEPSVKYRGIFINDEWSAFGTWATHHFGGVNAEMYEHVFELLLRLKANYLWPAMWRSNFNCDGPDLLNAELADEYGIVMGTSHHEPCMRNGEEYGLVRGKDSVYGNAWDFRANKEGILRFWEDGLKRNGGFENVITLGMRGEQDTTILGESATLADNINLLRDVIREQNKLIRKNVCEDLAQLPRDLVLFTEVEAFYYGDEETPGLMGDPELDGVTLMLSDDNFGNLRSVPTEEMRGHNGGYGLYYHFDFHGGAYAYDWMNTNYLPKVWEQLTMAYDYGIREIWVVNIGDICFLESPMSYFFELAFDMETWGSSQPNKTGKFMQQWIEQQFGGAFDDEDRKSVQEILDGYTRINHNRKPEVMNSEIYHPVHYGEAENLLKQAEHITRLAEELREKCPDWALPAYYELVYFPAIASMNLQRMQIIAGRNEFYARQNRVEANDLADEISRCIQKDRGLMDELHWINNGKWYGMGLSEHVGFVHWNEEGNRYPLMIKIEPANKPRIIVSKSDSSTFTEGYHWTGRPLDVNDFLRPDVNEVNIDIACGSRMPIAYKITTDCPWLSFSKTEGLVTRKDVLTITINRSLLQDRERGEVYIEAPDSRVQLNIWGEQADIAGLEPLTFLERDGYIAMEAEHFVYKHNVEGFAFTKLEQYGRTVSGMKVLPPLHDFTLAEDRPYLEFRFVAEQEGLYWAEYYLAPSNTAYTDHKLYLGVQMNNGEVHLENAVSDRFRSLDTSCTEWVNAVKDNIRIHRGELPCRRGLNVLRIYAVSPSTGA
ncbi:alpha-glucuronidase Gh115A [Paenibacillus terrae HPL-003]|uniref:Alpha-glucuronidase Gh115A n=1 Tax=Paenibacillus terrae (strain HPL-003) TaxID=985665 RepID=G7VPK0_PAETH|nr:glycosyl hydrolase 115 family protein [Paenibacillus terrae]AET60998.1 alpha-glucuronidase Gh115A [Paenibacillus terrae HPL-003]